jgi:hypothetical protein
MEDSVHFVQMIDERNIKREWVDRAEKNPDRIEDYEDGTRHFIKRISDNEFRWLRVVVNIKEAPNRRITAFFDRRLRKKDEDQNR